jgi:amino acid transporter
VFAESLHDVLRNRAFQQTFNLHLGDSPLAYWELRGLTVAVILGLALVNIRGVRWGGLLQLFITTVKVGSLLAILALPFVVAALARGASESPRPDAARLTPVWPDSWNAVKLGDLITAFLGVLWAYHGWMNIAPVAEEVARPQRNIPLALFAGVGIIIFLYLGANLAYYLIIPQSKMATLTDTTVATFFSESLLGPIGAAVASAAVMCSVFGALNGNLLVAPRLLYAMGEDGLAPRALRAVHPSYRTPALAILVMGAWSALLVLVLGLLSDFELLDRKKNHFNVLTDFAMFGAIIFETLAVATIFVFRRRFPDAERPYSCLGYPVVPILYVIILAAVVVSTFVNQTKEALTGVGFIAVGALVYHLVFRQHSAIERS